MNVARRRSFAVCCLFVMGLLPTICRAAPLTAVAPKAASPQGTTLKTTTPRTTSPKPSAPAATAAKPPEVKLQEFTFATAADISEERLSSLAAEALKSGLPNLPLVVIFRNDKDECLVDAKGKVSWQGGSTNFSVGTSGRLTVALTPDRAKGLKFSVPQGFTHVKQASFADEANYQPPSDFSYLDVDLMNDGEINTHIQHKLIELREKDFTPMSVFAEQLKRTRCSLELPEPSAAEFTAEELYTKFKPAVVVMAALAKNGQTRISSGVVITADGIVATNYHVMANDFANTTLIGAMTADGRVVPVREILAADRANDIAIVRIDAKDLTAATLSHGEPVGTPVTIIGHPNRRFYFLSKGYVCRYSRSFHAGEDRAYLEVSAEFMPGSSGGPALTNRGSVAGIVSSISQTDKGMTFKQCVPVQSIRRLIEKPARETSP